MTSGQFKKSGDQELKIEATLQKGGVYPLWVANGKGTPYAAKSITGLPGMLKVEPGPAFWVKMDDQDPVLYKGDTPVVLGAISDQVGIGRLRIGAYAPTKDEVFRASLGIADLSGDWISAAPPHFVYQITRLRRLVRDRLHRRSTRRRAILSWSSWAGWGRLSRTRRPKTAAT